MTLIADTGRSPNKDSDGSHMTERILNLTLEIIYLLTGEDFEVVKKTSSEQWAPNSLFHGPPDITTSTPHYQIPEKHNMQKILEVTKKMMELLTGEVPIRCQDITVYFSMEEWEYLEGHKDLYKDVMMDNQPPLTSPGGCCDLYKDIIVEPLSYKNPPERCPRHFYSWDSTQEGHTIPHHHQCEEDMDIKAWVKEEEETHLRGDRQSMEEVGMIVTMTGKESSLDLSTDGADVQDTSEEHLILASYYKAADNVMAQDPHKEGPITQRPSNGDRSTDTDESSDKSHIINLTLPPVVEPPPGVCRPEEPRNVGYRCSICNKFFGVRSRFVLHQRLHSGERPFPCLQCGKCFTSKSVLIRHQQQHSGVRPYSCSECGKSFTWKFGLLKHERRHTGVSLCTCSECGKVFREKVDLVMHQTSHREERPYGCSECGQRFKRKTHLTSHFRVHTGETFSCSECGKCYTRKNNLTAHQKTHTDQISYAGAE
ncbi:uncharacterized protein [Aquarana catesbeiana]|uniref:uncharacterized protein n=1 Tax=Aquarana catesbeiana TaxID=8400 RepID=UPI003CC98A33